MLTSDKEGASFCPLIHDIPFHIPMCISRFHTESPSKALTNELEENSFAAGVNSKDTSYVVVTSEMRT